MTLQNHISDLIRTALNNAQRDKLLPNISITDITVERSQKPEHGDFACNTALKLSRTMQTDPMSIAETISSLIPIESPLDKVWAIHPGFINFSLSHTWIAKQVDVILESGNTYGNITTGSGKHIQVEFVSVNPTGPLHVGHARGAVFGSALANILEATGANVKREYYINDAGSQMDRFNQSLYIRYLQNADREAHLPDDGYQGEYMVDLACKILEENRSILSLPKEEAISHIGKIGLCEMLNLIRADMENIRVFYDIWFSEQSLYDNGQYLAAMKLLDQGGYLVKREGATWFKSTMLGDNADKVFVRSDGTPTYFAADVAYHYNKFLERRFDRVINILGADHQGHVRFMKSVPPALGISPEKLDLIIYQLVTLKRGDEIVRASKRTGDFITLSELVEEVGVDACRYFFLSRSPTSQMEFDLDLAKKQSSENPVYYIQYAHARVSSILELANDHGINHRDGNLYLLSQESELTLIRKMLELPDLIEMMARTLEPHHIPHYAIELATAFHAFYENCRVVSKSPEDLEITKARLKLVEAAKVVLAKCLQIMIMSAPVKM